MSTFTAIDLSKLPAPQIVETLDQEVIIAEMKAHLIVIFPDAAPALALESSMLTKAIEVFAYREMAMRARFNDGSTAAMLAHGSGADLDNMGAFFGVERLIIQLADELAIPPIPLITESDDRLRARIQLSLEGYASAGPVGAYISHSMSAHTDVKDVGVASPTPGEVELTVLSVQGDGSASNELLAYVGAATTDEDVRPLTDRVEVQSATISHYNVTASLTLYEGPDSNAVLGAAIAATQAYVDENHSLGHDITISGLHGALHRAGVQNVALTSPAANIPIGALEAAFCDNINVTVGGFDA